MFGEHLAPDLIDDHTLFVEGRSAAVVHPWVVEGSEHPVPDAFTDRLMHIPPVVWKAEGR